MFKANRFVLPILVAVAAMPGAAQVVNDSFRVFTVHTPPEIARTDTIFGPAPGLDVPPPPGGVFARLVSVRDSNGTDLGCTPLANAEDIQGQIALIQRGGCGFSYKALQADKAGARAWVVYQDGRVPDDDCEGVIMSPSDSGVVVLIPGGFLPRCVAVSILPTLASGAEVTATFAPFVAVRREEDAREAVLALIVEPNPARGAFVVRVRTRSVEAVRLAIVDVIGRELVVLHRGSSGPSEHVFQVPSRLPAGVYRAVAIGPGLAVGRTFTVVQ